MPSRAARAASSEILVTLAPTGKGAVPSGSGSAPGPTPVFSRMRPASRSSVSPA